MFTWSLGPLKGFLAEPRTRASRSLPRRSAGRGPASASSEPGGQVEPIKAFTGTGSLKDWVSFQVDMRQVFRVGS